MILIGMFDSPYVRRVAISATHLGFAFEHRNWSVGRDAALIREYNPQGRVPVLVLDDGEALTESALILDHLDQLAGPQRALLPAAGAARREAQIAIALATGAVDKGIQLVYERLFRPEEKRHEPWLQRCRTQADGALAALDHRCEARGAHKEWLVGDAMTQADVTLACFCTYLHDAVPLDLSPYPALRQRVERYESLPLFRQFYVPFDAPVT
ncbi:glutathione S-transferase family protein [Pseudoxanthomonas sangjuensis]|uniref:glutathione S-transferase family protein n=1 Tax=Pseudoxanthomonas sangjuensis TaxID=1503750 RepID=UPI001390D0D7|nr:glutathione S-transferase family protein [Pseudoxanthomonas sangjuensis]KAF1714492.1 glutathione S-transferase [Pseudoxanthomonas sangjuensis]